jgi:hypothetical protein
LVVGDCLGHDGGVLAHAEQHRGLALAEEVDAAEVQAADHSAGAVVGEGEAHGVKGWEPEPACGFGAEPGAEDDGPDAGEVQLQRWVGVEGRWVGVEGRWVG